MATVARSGWCPTVMVQAVVACPVGPELVASVGWFGVKFVVLAAAWHLLFLSIFSAGFYAFPRTL